MAVPRLVVGASGVPALRGSGVAGFTRPNNTTAYTAGDVVSDSAGTFTPSLVFPIARSPGGGGYIVKATIATNLKTFLSAMTLQLYRSRAVVISGDNVAEVRAFGNAMEELGVIVFPAMATGTGAGSTEANALWTGNLEFRCAEGDDQLYGVLIDNTGSTPAAFQQFQVRLEADVY